MFGFADEAIMLSMSAAVCLTMAPVKSRTRRQSETPNSSRDSRGLKLVPLLLLLYFPGPRLEAPGGAGVADVQGIVGLLRTGEGADPF